MKQDLNKCSVSRRVKVLLLFEENPVIFLIIIVQISLVPLMNLDKFSDIYLYVTVRRIENYLANN